MSLTFVSLCFVDVRFTFDMSRRPISDEQRAALRRWYHLQESRPRQSEAAFWFERQYNHRITQSTVSDILSSKYAHLDGPSSVISSAGGSSFRNRPAQWPILEAILFDWQQTVEKSGKVITGDLVIEKAQQIWPLIPQYQGQSTPRFSSGWLNNFKKRHKVKTPSKPIKINSPTVLTQENAMILEMCSQYAENDIFEVGLFWQLDPSESSDYVVSNDEESRVTFISCTNYDGTEKFPLWVISGFGSTGQLANVNFQDLGCHWRTSSKGSLDTAIAADWLRTFYSLIGSDRSVLLLLNYSAAHFFTIELALPPPNVRVQWLPHENSTIQCQAVQDGEIGWLPRHEAYRLEEQPH